MAEATQQVAGGAPADRDGALPGGTRRARGGHRRLLIFGWHNVEGTYAFPSPPETGTAGLVRQFELLARAANVIDLGEAVRALAAGTGLPRRAVVITFDDGYQDNVDVAAPILHRLGLPATFFLVPEMLSRSVVPWWEELGWALMGSEHRDVSWQGSSLSLVGDERRRTLDRITADLKRVDESDRQEAVRAVVAAVRPDQVDEPRPTPIMGWDGARALRAMGFTIGSHSNRHSILANESVQAQQEDLAAARAQLSEGLGADIDLLAYPNGDVNDFSEVTVEAARRAGYRAGVTTIAGRNDASTDRFQLRRFVMYPEWGPKGFGIVPRHTVRRWLGRASSGQG